MYGVEGGSPRTVNGDLLYVEAYSSWYLHHATTMAQLKIYTKQKC